MKQNGFSLIEVMVAVGVMSLMSYFMMDMITNQNKAIKSTQIAMDLNEAQNRIQRYMLDSDICKDSLVDYSFPISAAVPISSLKKTGAPDLFSTAAGSNKVGGVEVESLIVTRQNSTDLELTIQFKKLNSKASYGGDSFIRKVSLSAQFIPATNTIKNCFSQLDNAVVTSVEQACLEVCPTCTWDPTKSPRCVKPAGVGVNKPLYRNLTTGEIRTNIPAPKTFENCISGKKKWDEAMGNASNSCKDSGGLVGLTWHKDGGCSKGQSDTGYASCNYDKNFVIEGYLTSSPN